MKKPTLQSRSPRKTPTAPGASAAAPDQASAAWAAPRSGAAPAGTAAAEGGAPPAAAAQADKATGGVRAAYRGPLWAVSGALLAVALMLAWEGLRPGPRVITQADIDQAVRVTLEKEPLPSANSKAYEAILPSVVRVTALMSEDAEAEEGENVGRSADTGPDEPSGRSVGTGVVIVDDGTILTNLHVVAGAKKLRVRFANGLVSDAYLVGAQPENDLAVLRATKLPDDLEAATMRSTADLRPGEEVIAVGHPFGIGPSVSAGVVSGLKREFRSPEGEKTLTNLIQFDAAANPGNSGGPLVTMDGGVVGIVTAILNPTEHRTFIGIGFAVPIESAASAAGMPPF